MQDTKLTAHNAYLTEMLRQAGLNAEAQIIAARIQSVLTDEIHHRMKNMLTVVTAIVRQTLRTAPTLAGAEEAIGRRLIAMAKAHDLLLKAELKSVSLRSIIHGAIEQHDTAAGRISITGDELEIIPSSILPLTLILNELCTNAIKYGALSEQQGRVALAWSLDTQGKMLTIRWAESGGPPVRPPESRSFGTRLIEGAMPRQLGGTGTLTFPSAGVEFELAIPFEGLKPVIPDGFQIGAERDPP